MVNNVEGCTTSSSLRVFHNYPHTLSLMHMRKLEDLKVLWRLPDLLDYIKIGQGQLRLIIELYFV